MAGIKQPIQDVITQLKTITDLQTVRVFNNQIAMEREGKYADYAKPAAFVEVQNDVEWGQLEGGVSAADLAFRIHLVHEYYDDQAGNFEQDLVIFDLRDKVIAALMLFEPTACSAMQKLQEQQDFDHDNLYEYTIDFITHFVDDKGAKQYISTTNPTPVINAQFTEPKNYIIPQP